MAVSCCSVIIVTHNSEKYISKAMESLAKQERQADQILIVDSGSTDTSYLTPYEKQSHVRVITGNRDIGFCRANNLAMEHLLNQTEYVFFLNPDAMIAPDFLEKAIAYLEDKAHADVGALTGIVYHYDIDKDCPSGRYDSTGIFQTWYGKWYDRGQGSSVDDSLYQKEETVPAICGAVYFCRRRALETILLRGSEVFDSTFYMYKDDIDLSLRLRRQGWKIRYVPSLIAYHCRGWNPNRKKMPRLFRLYSAWNECRIHAQEKSPLPLAYSLCKYAAVKLLDK